MNADRHKFISGLTALLQQFPDDGHVVISARTAPVSVSFARDEHGVRLSTQTPPKHGGDVLDAMRALGWADPDEDYPDWTQWVNSDEPPAHLTKMAAMVYATFEVLDRVGSLDNLTYDAWRGEDRRPVTISDLGLEKIATA